MPPKQPQGEPKTSPGLKQRLFQILLALADTERNGLEIMREVLETTEGRVQLWPGTLYTSLKELAGRGWVEEVEDGAQTVRGGSPRFYRITQPGRRRLREELSYLENILQVARNKEVASRS